MPADLATTVRDALADGGTLLVLTGAGISAESGVPTFRGPEGYWTVGSHNYHPQELATAAAFARMPRDVWHWYLYRRGVCRGAAPNAAHLALATAAEQLGDRLVLVTQNVDGLHLRAGSPAARTLQIHGNIDYARCTDECTDDLVALDDDMRADKISGLSDELYARLRCPHCAALMRPHVLWFDEYYDEPRYRAESAMHAAADAALLVVVGTAGATNLPQQIAARVARSGRPIIDIDVDTDNPFARLALRSEGHALHGTAVEHLPPLLRTACDLVAGT
jgi:NAD-dependent deacetylase